MTTIRITRQHIEDGDRLSSNSCPVVRGLQEAFPGMKVLADYYWLTVKGKRYSTPEDCRIFMFRFDDGKSRKRLKPFEFELEVAS